MVEKKEDGEEKLFANRINILIDKSMKEFESVRDPEVNDFRLAMIDRCRAAVEVNTMEPQNKCVLYREVFSLFGVSFIGGSTVYSS